jgi:DNA-binding NtrC family response regulator
MVSEQKVTVDLIQNLLPIEEIEIHNLYDVSNTFAEFKEKTEKIFIEKQLILNNWNISKTAEAMDIQRSHLYNKLKKYGLDKKVDNNG